MNATFLEASRRMYELRFRASAPGEVPLAGPATIGGIALPDGERTACYWVTRSRLTAASEVASELASLFPQTGLWPLGWAWSDEGPEDYLPGGSLLDGIDAGHVGAIMREQWPIYGQPPAMVAPFVSEFPGLADAAPELQPSYDTLFEALDERPGWMELADRQLLLVPCVRPADAFAVLGWEGQRLDTASVCSVMRSWEERFGAVPVDMSPSSVTFGVTSPPVDIQQAQRLAAEVLAVASVEQAFHDGGLEDLASKLVKARRWDMNFDE